MERKDSPRQRRQALAHELRKRRIDSIVISSPIHVHYFTGYSAAYRTDKARLVLFLIISEDGSSFLLLAQSEVRNAKKTFDEEIFTFEDYKLEERMVSYPAFTSGKFGEFLANLKRGRNVNFTRTGVEDWHLPQIFYSVISQTGSVSKPIGLSDVILRMRKTKGRDEISHIREAAIRLDYAYKIAKSFSKRGYTEMDLYGQVNSEFFHMFGPSSLALGAYVSGRRTLRPAAPYYPTKRKFVEGDMILLDLQTSFNEHWADTARVFAVGNPTQKQESVLAVLRRAKKSAELLLKPGTEGKDIYSTISRVISEAGYSKVLPHHAGHGLGLEDQEAPFFLPNSHDILEEGDVVAIEPGIYESSAGGMRIEDNYVITRDGFEKLSNFPLQLS